MDDLLFRLAQAHARNLKRLARGLDPLDARLRHHDLRVRAGAMRRELESHAANLAAALTQSLTERRRRVETAAVALHRPEETLLLRRRSAWDRLHSSLNALSPTSILSRGYALVFDADGHVVKRAASLLPGERSALAWPKANSPPK